MYRAIGMFDGRGQLDRIDRYIDWLLAVADEPDNTEQEARVRAFVLVLLLHTLSHLWLLTAELHQELVRTAIVTYALVWLLVAFLIPQWTRVSVLGIVCLYWLLFSVAFPTVANHYGIELIFLTLVACFNLKQQEERRLFLQTARWLVVLILFASGVQKILYGT